MRLYQTTIKTRQGIKGTDSGYDGSYDSGTCPHGFQNFMVKT